jgi:fluoride ion exporter CrcB/FEX
MVSETFPLAASPNVALGGAAGPVLRYRAARFISGLAGAAKAFAWGTRAINIAGMAAVIVRRVAAQGSGA